MRHNCLDNLLSIAFVILIIVNSMPILTNVKYNDLYNVPNARDMSMNVAKKKTKKCGSQELELNSNLIVIRVNSWH